MMNLRRIVGLLPALLLPAALLHAQDKYKQFSPINTAIPSLSIAPDARGGGMGDIGAATLPAIHSQYWNASKYAFMESKAGVGISYTPWLRKLVKDVYMAYASGYYKPNDRSAVGASLRYFSLGEVPVTNLGGQQITNLNPYEMAFDLSYGMKLSENYSMAVALRYIRSDMNASINQDLQPANAVSVDVSGYLAKYVYLAPASCTPSTTTTRSASTSTSTSISCPPNRLSARASRTPTLPNAATTTRR